jgi:hypothetical protein
METQIRYGIEHITYYTYHGDLPKLVFIPYHDSLLRTDENTNNAFFLNFFIMKKNMSIRIEAESSDVDDDSKKKRRCISRY